MEHKEYIKEILEYQRQKEQDYKEFMKETHKQMVDKNYFWFATRENYDKVIEIKNYLDENKLLTPKLKDFFRQAHLFKKRGKLEEYIAISKSLLK